MRTYGRVALNPLYPDVLTWIEVQTDANGFNDAVYVTAMIQELKLNLGESPFWGNRGIPAVPSVVQQVAPDYYSYLIQQRYAPFFASLVLSRSTVSSGKGLFVPTYQINVVTNQGSQLIVQVPG